MAKKQKNLTEPLNSVEDIADYIIKQLLIFERQMLLTFDTFENAQYQLNNQASYHSNISYVALSDEDKLIVLHLIWDKLHEGIDNSEESE